MNLRLQSHHWKACLALLLVTAFVSTAAAQAPLEKVWRFDNTTSIGGYPVKVLGHPQVVETEIGKAIRFNGVDDALFFPVHPLAGDATWTWEMIFKPDADGKPAQRIFHLQSVDATTGQDIRNERMLFEIRIVKGEWCLDSFATADGQARTLLNCDKLHPFGKWYRVTAVYDGKMLRNYVGGELQGEGELSIPAERPGRASLGTRIDLRDFYKGEVYEARFTPRALQPDEFLKMPDAK